VVLLSFLSTGDVEAIQTCHWVHRRSFLALHKWYIRYNPSNNLIWVKLPNLPLEMWSKETLTQIGNSIGRFVYVDPWCLGEKDKCIAWILIEKAYRGGFPDHIEIAWSDLKIKQRLDFWGIPFRCSTCHSTRHLIKNFPRCLIIKRGVYHEKLWAVSPLSSEKEKLSPTACLSLMDLEVVQDLNNLDNRIIQSPQYFSQDYSLSLDTKPENLSMTGVNAEKEIQTFLCLPPWNRMLKKQYLPPLDLQAKGFYIGFPNHPHLIILTYAQKYPLSFHERQRADGICHPLKFPSLISNKSI